jgi:hypothetical protein
LLADRGYDSDAIREDSWFHGTDPVIPRGMLGGKNGWDLSHSFSSSAFFD